MRIIKSTVHIPCWESFIFPVCLVYQGSDLILQELCLTMCKTMTCICLLSLMLPCLTAVAWRVLWQDLQRVLLGECLLEYRIDRDSSKLL